MQKVKAIESLKEFIKLMAASGISDKKAYLKWSKENKERMEKFFWHKQKSSMPPIYSLVTAFFHPTLPLIGLNYTPTAHNTLYAFKNGWTDPLRFCRGIVFDNKGNLVALPFSKFFNYGEHEETTNLPNEPFDATIKHDGHLGIIFEYNDRLLLTTRGDFISRTSKIGNEMLVNYINQYDWQNKYPKDLTLLVEIICPETKIFVDYKNWRGFIIIGAFNRKTFEDYDYEKLGKISKALNLPLVNRWTGKSLNELIALMKDNSVKNQEGFVVRFKNGLRVKLKFKTHIAKMVESKLSYNYLMKRIMNGNLERMIETLPEEIYKVALEMLGKLLVASTAGTLKDRLEQLYKLVPLEKSTPYYRSICRKFIKSTIKCE